MKKITVLRKKLKKKLTVNTLSFMMAAGLLLLVVPFVAIAAGKEEPEPGKKGDFSIFKGLYAASQVILTEDSPEFVMVSAEVGEVESYQWQVYSTQDEKYIDIEGRTGKEFYFNAESVRPYHYGDGKCYFRCHAINGAGEMLTSDVLTVVLPAVTDQSEPSQTEDTAATVETIEINEPTQPSEISETENTTATTAATADVSDPTQAAEETEPTTEPADADTPEDPTEEVENTGSEEDLTPIKGMLLAPLRGTNDINIMFDLDGGLGVSNTLNATTGDSLIVGTPSKSGYIFTGWTVIDPTDLSADEKTALETEADNGNLTVPAYNVTFKANWVAQPAAPSTNYTIVYWLQNAAAGDNGYSVYSSKTVSGATPGSSVTLSSDDLLFPTSNMRSYVSTYKSNSERTKTINADGSTVFNVYYDRKTYTITFNVNKPPSPFFGSVSDPVFASGHSLTFTAKYGQKINTLWSDDSWVTTHPQLTFFGNVWTTYYLVGIDVNGTVIRNKPMYLTSDIISNGNTSSYSFNMEWDSINSSNSTYTIVYRFQTVQQAINNNTLVGNFQTRPDVPNQTVYTDSTNPNNFTEVPVDGFTFYSQNSRSRTIYRNYTRNSYKLHYANTSIDDATLYYEQSFTKPSDPTKSGYTFAGWYADAALTDPITDAEWASMTMPAHDAYVYAKWTKNPEPTNDVAVYLYKESGTLQDHLTTITTTSGDPAIPDSAVQNRSRDGYRFVGWYYDDNGTVREFVFNSTVVNTDLMVYGKWEVNSYTVTFYNSKADVTGGTSLEQINDISPGATVTSAQAPTATPPQGYSFDKWCYGDDAAFFNESGVSGAINANTNVYATYKANQYPLTFHGTSLDPVQVAYGSTLTGKKPNPDPTRVGYDFSGWYRDEEYTQKINDADWETITMPVGGFDVYAKWTKQKYTVTFHTNLDFAINGTDIRYRFDSVPYNTTLDGTFVNSSHPEYGTLAVQSDTDTEAFDGWYYDADHPNAPTASVTHEVRFNFDGDGFSDPVCFHMRIYAKWIPKHTVSFYNEKADGVLTDLVSSVKVKEGDSLSENDAPTPSKAGYTFVEWCYGDDLPYFDAGIGVAMGTEDVDVYATWVKNEISLVIHNNGGDNVFTVSGGSGAALRLAIPAGGSVTVTHLPFGNYTVTNGTWDYRNVTGSSAQSVDATSAEPGQVYNVTFGGSSRNLKWLGADARVDNRFIAIPGTQG